MKNKPVAKLVVDPVCKMELRTDQAAATLKFNRRTYYFCHVACLRLFEADPLAYLDEGHSQTGAAAGEAGANE